MTDCQYISCLLMLRCFHTISFANLVGILDLYDPVLEMVFRAGIPQRTLLSKNLDVNYSAITFYDLSRVFHFLQDGDDHVKAWPLSRFLVHADLHEA